MLRAKLVRQCQEADDPAKAAREVLEELLGKSIETHENREVLEGLLGKYEHEKSNDAIVHEQSKPKAPRGKASSDKRAKGRSSQRQGYG